MALCKNDSGKLKQTSWETEAENFQLTKGY